MNQETKGGLDALIAVAATQALSVERELAENLRDACGEKPALAQGLAKLLQRHGEEVLVGLLVQLGRLHTEEIQLRTKAAGLAVQEYLPSRRLVRRGN